MTEVDLSPKHEPLFKLLEAWNVCFNDDFHELDDDEKFEVIDGDDQTKYYNQSFLDLPEIERNEWVKLSRVDTVIEYGGRDSGKSFATSLFIPIAVSDYNHRCLYTRYVMNTTDHSISTAIDERMDLIGYSGRFEYANNSYSLNDNEKEGKIFITGMKTSSLNQTAKLKSLEDFTMFVADEAEEIKTFDEWNKIKRSLRGSGCQNIALLIFNPPTKAHWLFEEFFEEVGVEAGFSGIRGNVMYIHTTYKDNIKYVKPNNLREYNKLEISYNTYMATDKEDREGLPVKIKKAYNKYKNEVLGGFMDSAEGVIYEDWHVGAFDEDLPSCHGLDFGSADPDALVEVAIDINEKLLYVKQKYFQNNTGFQQLFEVLDEMVGRQGLIVGDWAERRLIKDYYNMGINIKKCRKGKVKDRIKKVQSYTIIIDPESHDIMKALNNYCWKDYRSGLTEHEYSHLPHAIEYAFNELTSL